MNDVLEEDRKNWALKTAVEITKEAARGGKENLPKTLRALYEELLKIRKENIPS
ncbi:MAG: hypothetical protein JEZ12_16130 [Desulfobacterium sp.]|nr:hypothetical protein [Desulfobacterium sp.]